MIGPADVAVEDGTLTIAYAWGSLEDDNLKLATQTISGLHSDPAACTPVKPVSRPPVRCRASWRLWSWVWPAALLVRRSARPAASSGEVTRIFLSDESLPTPTGPVAPSGRPVRWRPWWSG